MKSTRVCEECGERRRFFWHCHDQCSTATHLATCAQCGVLNLLNWKPRWKALPVLLLIVAVPLLAYGQGPAQPTSDLHIPSNGAVIRTCACGGAIGTDEWKRCCDAACPTRIMQGATDGDVPSMHLNVPASEPQLQSRQGLKPLAPTRWYVPLDFALDAAWASAIIGDRLSTNYALNHCAKCFETSPLQSANARTAVGFALIGTTDWLQHRYPEKRKIIRWFKLGPIGLGVWEIFHNRGLVKR